MRYKHLTDAGVIIVDENTTYIGEGVKIGAGVTIYPNNSISGDTVIGKDTVLEPNNVITNAKIGEGCLVLCSVIKDSSIGSNVSVGPFAYLRPNSEVGNNCKIGDFVEIKASKIGDGSKVPHLSYVGDAEVGEKCNIGCGVIFCNYDGNKKHRTTVGDNTFIGSNSNLVAPVSVGKNCFVAAGTTVTRDTGDKKFIIGRVKQTENKKLADKYLKADKNDG